MIEPGNQRSYTLANETHTSGSENVVKIGLGLITLLLFGAGTLHVSAANAYVDPTYLVFQFQELQFTNNVDGALALLSDDAVVSGRGLCANPCTGKAAIRPEILRAAASGTRSTIVNLGMSPGKVDTRQESRSAAIRAAGVERIINVVAFELKDDKISAIRVTMDRTDPQTAAFLDFQARGPAAPAAVPATQPVAINPPSTGSAGLASLQRTFID